MTFLQPLLHAVALTWIAAAPAAEGPPPAPPPPMERAVYLLSACDGAKLAPARQGAPQRLDRAPNDASMWVFEPAGGGRVRIKSFATGDYLTPRLAMSSSQAQAAGWSLGSAPDGAITLVGPDRRALALAAGDARASLTAPDEGCASRFLADPFPMFAPTTRTVHVDAQAAGGGDGSRERPLRSIQTALERARPGDRILVAPGLYKENIEANASVRGAPDAWIVLESAVTHGARIDPPGARAAIQLNGAYIEVHGFHVTNRQPEPCVGSEGAHLRIVQNWLQGCGGGGVALARGDRYHVEGNVAAYTSFKNRWQMSGISMFQARGGKNCPDYCNIVRRNVAFGNDNKVKTWDGQPPSDGNGVIIDDFRNYQLNSRHGRYPGRTLVEHNLVFANGGSGIRVFMSDNVVVRRNTAAFNHTRSDTHTWRGEIMNSVGSNNLMQANVAVADRTLDRANAALFDSGTFRTPRGASGQARWSDNAVAATPSDPAYLMRMARGAPPAGAYVQGAPEFVDPKRDGRGSFKLRGAKTNIGADERLLPVLK